MAKTQKLLYLILVFGLSLRLFCLFAFPQPIKGDSPAYDKSALSFINGEGLMHAADRVPLYPLFLALVYMVFGHSYIVVYLAQVIIDIFSAFLIYHISLRVFKDIKTSLLSVLMYAVYPTFVLNTITLLSETLFTFLLCLFVLAILIAITEKRQIYFFISGFMLGLTSLCKPVAQMLFLIFMFYIAYLFINNKKQIARFVLLYFIGFAIILSPWIIRNYIGLKTFVPSTTTIGYHFFFAHARIEDKDFLGDTNYEKFGEALKMYNIGNHPAVEGDKILFNKTIALIFKHPYRYILMCLNRLIRLWLDVGYGYQPSGLAWMVMYGQILIIFLVVIGIVFFKNRLTTVSAPLWILIFYFSLIHSLIHAAYRYIVPVMPYTLQFSAYTVIKFFEKVKTQTLC